MAPGTRSRVCASCQELKGLSPAKCAEIEMTSGLVTRPERVKVRFGTSDWLIICFESLTRSARVTSPLVIAISAHLAGDNPFSSWHDAHTLDRVAGAMTARPDRFCGEG